MDRKAVRRTGVRAGVVAALVVGALALGAVPAYAAAPRVMLIYGGGLSRPIVLGDWNENLALMSATADAPAVTQESLGRRPSFRVAMFWGNEWAGRDPLSLKPEQGNQMGRYYPRIGSADALFTFDSIPGPGAPIRWLLPEGVQILTRHGVPAKALPAGAVGESTPASPAGWLPLLLGGAAVVAASALAIAVRRRAPRRAT